MNPLSDYRKSNVISEVKFAFYKIGCLDDIDTAIKMLMECALGEDVYSSTKTAYDIGGAVRKLQDAYNMLEERVYEI